MSKFNPVEHDPNASVRCNCGAELVHRPGSLGMYAAGEYASWCKACNGAHRYKGDCVYLLEKAPKSCDSDSEYRVVSNPCKCRFCNECVEWMGYRLRDRVREIVRTYKNPMMLTLTIDPTLFADAMAAFFWVRAQRSISRLIRGLVKAGYLSHRHYFAVIEWHKSGWCHWHLLVDSAYCPIEKVSEIWGRNRPKSCGPVEPGRPEFGFCWYTKKDGFADGTHAANYAVKYLLKNPDEGYADWVLDLRGVKVHRYQTSRGFFRSIEPPKDVHDVDCFCDDCREGGEASEVFHDDSPEESEEEAPPRLGPKRQCRPIRQRVADCRSTCVVLKARRDGGWSFVGPSVLSWPEVQSRLQVTGRASGIHPLLLRRVLGLTSAWPSREAFDRWEAARTTIVREGYYEREDEGPEPAAKRKATGRTSGKRVEGGLFNDLHS